MVFNFFLAFSSICVTAHSADFPVMTVPELIEFWGYSCQSHFVTTSDGFILQLQRILPRSKKSSINMVATKPIFLQHGLFGSSARFTAGPPHKVGGYNHINERLISVKALWHRSSSNIIFSNCIMRFESDRHKLSSVMIHYYTIYYSLNP